MKLEKRLLVNGVETPLVQDNIMLDQNRAGRAMFLVQSEQDLAGEVAFSMGWNFSDKLARFFTGDVDPVHTVRINSQQIKLFCREKAGRMDANLPLSLRHPTLKDVLQAYAGQTGLRFVLPDKSYASTKIPSFYGVGSGFHALGNFGNIFNIPDYCWLSQGDGAVFVGSHADSVYAIRKLDIPQNIFHGGSIGGWQRLNAIPNLRPGAIINGARLLALKFSGHTMEVQCQPL